LTTLQDMGIKRFAYQAHRRRTRSNSKFREQSLRYVTTFTLN